MKFITVNTLEAHLKDDLDIVYINIDHIVTITDHWIENEELDILNCHAKILLSNGSEIICEESIERLEKEFKKLFKQY
jgi:hypothetical protein